MSDVIAHEPSYTVDEFCKAERISRVALYAMWRSDRGPRFYLNARCRRITHKARLDWQAEREAEVNGGTNTPPEAIAPAEVLQDQGEGEEERKKCTDESTPLKPKRKLGGVWREGRYLYRVGPTGITVFDAWQWTDEPPLRRVA
jgi:hypothetical protein